MLFKKNAENTPFWLNTIVLPGSDNYYALRKIKSEKQAAIKVILALFEIIFQIPLTLSDDNLVRIKLRWWKEEVIKTQQGRASHPVSIELIQVMEKYSLNYNALLQFITTIENLIQNAQFPTEQSLRDFYTYSYGIRERMMVKILDSNIAHLTESVDHLAYALALIDNLRSLRQRAMKAYIFFSDEEARELEINKSLILTMTGSVSLRKLFEKSIEKAKEHVTVGLNIAGKKPAPALSFLISRNYLGLEWCKLVCDEDFKLFTHHTELAPLRKWWCLRH